MWGQREIDAHAIRCYDSERINYYVMPSNNFLADDKNERLNTIRRIRDKIKANNILTAETVDTRCKQTYPILFYAIEDIIEAGAKEIGIIVGPNKEQVMETVKSVDWNADIDFIYQEEPK